MIFHKIQIRMSCIGTTYMLLGHIPSAEIETGINQKNCSKTIKLRANVRKITKLWYIFKRQLVRLSCSKFYWSAPAVVHRSQQNNFKYSFFRWWDFPVPSFTEVLWHLSKLHSIKYSFFLDIHLLSFWINNPQS